MSKVRVAGFGISLDGFSAGIEQSLDDPLGKRGPELFQWYSQNEYDVSKGYTYMYFKGLPLYPFGHGLSYTTFSYSNLKIAQSGTKLTVSFDIKNSGDRSGADVAHLYTHQRVSSTYQPIKSLRAFQSVTLNPASR